MAQDQERPFQPMFQPSRDDDLSTHRHRVVIGGMGALLPLLVWFVSKARPADPTLSEPLSSISAYYYSGAVAIFTGILACLAVYFLTYSGYDNKDRWKDRTTAIVAAIAAIGVACFPTDAPSKLLALPWWQPYLRTIHLISAGALFGAFIVFASFLFPKSDPRKGKPSLEKRTRNIIYRACGLIMFVAIVSAGIRARSSQPIFWQETIALEAFAISWLVKGKVRWTARQLLHRARNPKRFAEHVVKEARRPQRKRQALGDDG
jgi:MFS family permease